MSRVVTIPEENADDSDEDEFHWKVMQTGDEICRGEVSRQETQLYKPSVVNVSGEDITLLEFSHDVVITNEPLIILLENTISDTITELIDDSVET